SKRIDHIIDDVLGMSRRSDDSRESLMLAPWLRDTIREFETHNNHNNDTPPIFSIEAIHADRVVCFEPMHLRQVLHNLWQNALRHARRAQLPLHITLVGRQHE